MLLSSAAALHLQILPVRGTSVEGETAALLQNQPQFTIPRPHALYCWCCWFVCLSMLPRCQAVLQTQLLTAHTMPDTRSAGFTAKQMCCWSMGCTRGTYPSGFVHQLPNHPHKVWWRPGACAGCAASAPNASVSPTDAGTAAQTQPFCCSAAAAGGVSSATCCTSYLSLMAAEGAAG